VQADRIVSGSCNGVERSLAPFLRTTYSNTPGHHIPQDRFDIFECFVDTGLCDDARFAHLSSSSGVFLERMGIVKVDNSLI
jgi:hypothetical protein